MHEYFLCLLFASIINISYGQPYLISAHKITTIPKESLNMVPGFVPKYDVDMYYVLYHTTDAQGNATQASGALMVPVTDTCDFFPYVSFQHGTVLRKNDVPSRNNGEAIAGQFFAALGYVSSMPDYVGLGDSPGLHLYLHAETEATATLNLIRASRAYLSDTLNISDNGQLFLAGYSQGGHATMAAHKYIEDNNLTQEFNVVASAPAAGPYHLSGAQADMIFLNPAYPRQGYIIYLLFAFNEVYQNLFTHPSQVLKPPYDQTIPPYLNGNYNMTALNNALPDSLHEYLQDSVYQLLLDHYTKNHPIWQNLEENDNYNWKPNAPIRMLYCEADEQVTYLNAVNALQAMQANGANDVQALNLNTSGTHSSCTGPAFLSMISWFNTLAQTCYNTSYVSELQRSKTNLFPNPTNGSLYITNAETIECISIYNAFGQKVLDIKLLDANTLYPLNLDFLADGVYFIQIQTKNNTLITEKLIKYT